MAALGDDHLLTCIHPVKQFGQAGLCFEHPNGDGHTKNLVNWCSGVDPHVAQGRLGCPRFLDSTNVRTSGSQRSIRVSVACALSLGTRPAVPEAPLVLAAWIRYAHVRLGRWPEPDDAGSLSVPTMGWVNPGQSLSPDRMRQ